MKDVIIVILVVALFVIGFISYDKSKPINNLQQQQINLDSVTSYYNVKIDSIDSANLILKSKIKDKNEIINTLKSLVNNNNKKYQVITDSALVVELEKERAKGIR